MKPSAERQPQRRIVGFYQGFGEAGAVVGRDGEIRGGIEGADNRSSKSQSEMRIVAIGRLL
ncbi:hypothetical protein ECZU22_24070 [Escherichia coli]|nr:hypothetical protein ECZU22_24070 [Escherichia coli]